MIKFLRHLFYPQVSNNYRARILHFRILSLAILFFFSAGFLTYFVRNNYPQVLGISSNIAIDQLLVLTNQKRQEVGVAPLSLNEQLDQAAQAKGQDMFTNNYWAHISPSGTTPWYFIKNAGYSYVYAGENLARGYTTSQDVVNAWMASPTHRENMLSPNYQNVGFAILTGNLTGEDTVLVVEMFGRSTLAATDNKPTTKEVATAPGSSSQTTPQAASPTPEVTENNSTPAAVQNKIAIASNPASLVNAQTFSSNIVTFAVAVFMFVLILDMIVIERKKILRFVGHNLDHILFLGLILAIVFIVLKGVVL